MPDLAITSYSEFKQYDPTRDGETLTLIGYTGRGAYWVKAALTEPGRKRREQRADLLARLQRAVTLKQEPGEVSLDGPSPLVEQTDGSERGEDQGIW